MKKDVKYRFPGERYKYFFNQPTVSSWTLWIDSQSKSSAENRLEEPGTWYRERMHQSSSTASSTTAHVHPERSDSSLGKTLGQFNEPG